MRNLFPLLVFVLLLNGCSGQQEAIQAGRKLLGAQKFKEAEAAFSKVIESEPKNAEAWYCRGYARLQQGSFSAAVPDFDKAILLAPECKSCGDSLGLYHFQRGLSNYLSGNYSPGAADFQKAIDLKHDLANSYTYLGICQGLDGDDISAIQSLNTAVKTDPNNHFALSNRGYYNSKLGDNRAAIADFTKAIGMDPKDKTSYLNRGYTYIGMGDYATAILDFQKALEIDPEYMGALAYMGIALTNTDRPEEALPYLDKAIAVSPENATLYYYRGAAYVNVGQLDKGCADLRHALDNGDDQGLALIQQYCK